MERYMITQSLLSSWQYVFSCMEGYEEDARQEFMNALRREKKPATQEMQNGIDFENLVYSISTGIGTPRNNHPEWQDGANKVASFIKFAPVQVRVQRELTIGDMTFLCYGVLDALKAGTIYDVKFSNKDFNRVDLVGKYLESPQHPMYFYLVPEAFLFKYLVSDGSDIYVETYERGSTPTIQSVLKNFIDYLEQESLMEIYKEHWKAKP